MRAVCQALADPAGVTAHRPGALKRVHLAMSDGRDTRARLADVEARMVAVLDDLGLTGLVTTIAGLTPVGVAAILAETGDPARFATQHADHRWRQPLPRRLKTRAGRARTSLEDLPRAEAWAAPPVSSSSSIHAVGNNPLES